MAFCFCQKKSLRKTYSAWSTDLFSVAWNALKTILLTFKPGIAISSFNGNKNWLTPNKYEIFFFEFTNWSIWVVLFATSSDCSMVRFAGSVSIAVTKSGGFVIIMRANISIDEIGCTVVVCGTAVEVERVVIIAGQPDRTKSTQAVIWITNENTLKNFIVSDWIIFFVLFTFLLFGFRKM